MEQQPYTFVDHTADYAMRAWGADFPRLVENAATGFIHLMADVAGLEPTSTIELRVTGDSREQVLVHALKELLFLREEGRLPVAVEVLEADSDTARLRIHLTSVASARDRLRAGVKAVTYHGLEVTADADGLTAQVVFDT